MPSPKDGRSASASSTAPLSQPNLLLQATLPFLIGGVCGCIATCCIQSIDMVKVRIQLADSHPTNIGSFSSGSATANVKQTTLRIARDIISQGRFLDLYSGLSAALARQVVYGTARLGFFFTFEDLLKHRAEAQGRKSISFAERAAAGLAAGGLGAALGDPIEVALIRMQSDGLLPLEQRARYRGVLDALTRTTKAEGVGALWSGA